MRRIMMPIAAAALLSGCSLIGIRSGYEQPPYEVLGTIGEDVEIRRYGARLAAETTVESGAAEEARNEAFQRLFDYISGGNESRSEVAMTAPVQTGDRAQEIAMTVPVETADADQQGYTMRFFLPSSYTLATAPAPSDPRVDIVEVPAATVAVLRFSGARDERTIATRQESLLEKLDNTRWQPVGAPSAMFYDPPWTLPFFRRNEVAVNVVP